MFYFMSHTTVIFFLCTVVFQRNSLISFLIAAERKQNHKNHTVGLICDFALIHILVFYFAYLCSDVYYLFMCN